MFIHKKSGRAYEVLTTDALVQIDNDWRAAVIYKAVYGTSLPTFIREASDFDAKFVEVDPNQTPVGFEQTLYQKANRGY